MNLEDMLQQDVDLSEMGIAEVESFDMTTMFNKDETGTLLAYRVENEAIYPCVVIDGLAQLDTFKLTILKNMLGDSGFMLYTPIGNDKYIKMGYIDGSTITTIKDGDVFDIKSIKLYMSKGECYEDDMIYAIV